VTETVGSAAFASPRAVAALVRNGMLDAELAGLLSLTLQGGIPLLVAGAEETERLLVRDALATLLPSNVPVVRLAGAEEDFAWMPHAAELGWRRSGRPAVGRPGAAMIASLEVGDASATWGDTARLAIRALSVGYTLLATAVGASLEDVLARLAQPPVGAIDDELAWLGVVLVLGAGSRVEVAHYLRPVARDPGGHVQRLPPAVLAAWNGKTARYDHFAWGVTAELAARTGRRPIDLDREQSRRASVIAATATGI
jgi:hypothetical protein